VRAFGAVVAAVALFVAGGTAGWLLRGEDTGSTTVTRAVTREIEGTLPAAVDRKRQAIAAAARARDVEALRKLIPPSGFTFTYGESGGGPIAYWQKLDQTSDERPFETLARILELPYSLRQGIYVWPFAYGLPKDEATAYERRLLGPLFDSYAGEDYYGWRAGIRPDGSWIFFVRGD
jgi:hypothetical protein